MESRHATLPGNHRIAEISPHITLGCMDPSARDLMDRALARYDTLIRSGRARRRVRDFVRWLFRKSGLIDDVGEENAFALWSRHMDESRARLKDHPNPSFRRRMSRGCIYGFSYWFFRWSGLVGPDGGAPGA